MTTPADNLVPLTGNALIDGLTWGAAWQFDGGSHTLTYSLSLNDTIGNQPAWTPALSDAARRALTAWSNVANLSFVESGSGGVYDQSPADLAFLLTGNELQTRFSGLVALGIPPSPSFADNFLADAGASRSVYRQPEGDIAMDNYATGAAYTDAGGVALTVLLHEIGHALGLKHTDNGPAGRPTFASLGIANLDSHLYTVMSYTDALGQTFGSNLSSGNAATPMPLDILAIQQIYGANTGYHTGDDTYLINPSGVYSSASTIWDAGGNDTLSFRADSAGSGTIDLRQGHYTSISGNQVAIAYNATIENAVGGNYGDTLIGNAADNRLDGGAGNDSMTGGIGNDTYVIDAVGDAVAEQAGEGADTIISSVSLALSGNVENLTLSGSSRINGTGNELDNVITGNFASNSLTGGAGNDTLDGGGSVDSMQGGAGNDVYIVSETLAGTPNTLELSGEPGAYIFSGATFSSLSPAPLFNLQDRTGDGLVDHIYIYRTTDTTVFSLTIATNQLGQNLAVGNYLDAQRAPFAAPGHAGLDLGYNGRGSNQVYGSFSIAAIDIDYSGGTPSLQSLALSFELHSESPTAPATFGLVNYNYFGGAAAPESVIELMNEGYDEVRAGISYVLAENVEKLTLTGSAAIDGTGNALDNLIVGNGGANALAGGIGKDALLAGEGDDSLDGGTGNDRLDGGAGADSMTGASGADQFIIDNLTASDTIVDFSPADDVIFLVGTDFTSYYGTGVASPSIEPPPLPPGPTEPPTVTNTAPPTATAETPTTTAPPPPMYPVVAAYSFSYAGIASPGTMPSPSNPSIDRFKLTTEALDADDRILYNPVTGAVYFDSDGDGSAAAVQIATLGGAPTVSYADFYVNPGNFPALVHDSLATSENSAIAFDVLANDYLPAGWMLNNFSLASGSGSVVQNSEGNLVFDPGNNYDALSIGESATATIGYSVIDQTTLGIFSGTATVTIHGMAEHRAGTAGNDSLNGTAYADSFEGFGGNDTLGGGAGLDIAHYSGLRSEYKVIRIAPGQFTVTDTYAGNGDDGVDTLSGIERLQFSNGAVNVPIGPLQHLGYHATISVFDSPHDFNGDGKADLLSTSSDGSTAISLMDGANTLAMQRIGPYAGWTAVDARADYNGDGKADLTWQHRNGSIALWLMDGVAPTAMEVIDPHMSWSALDNQRDFNGDGKSDLLWQQADGSASIWLMDGTDTAAAKAIGRYAGWSVADARGDYNADGKADLAWQHADGSTVLWLMDGVNLTATQTLAPGAGWPLT